MGTEFLPTTNGFVVPQTNTQKITIKLITTSTCLRMCVYGNLQLRTRSSTRQSDAKTREMPGILESFYKVTRHILGKNFKPWNVDHVIILTMESSH